jgi:heme/copper-type cytochrome/quinol oxidase subunit 2
MKKNLVITLLFASLIAFAAKPNTSKDKNAILLKQMTKIETELKQTKDSLKNIQDNHKSIHEKYLQNSNTELLEKKNSELKEQKAEIIGTLQWTVGAFLIIIVAFLGSSVYFNYRSSKEANNNSKKEMELRLEELKRAFEIEISEKLGSLTSSFKANTKNINDDFVVLSNKINDTANTTTKEMNANFVSLTKELNENVKKDNSKLVDAFQKQLKEFNENYRLQIATIEKSFDERIESSEKELEQHKEYAIKTMENTNDTIEAIKKSLTAKIDANVKIVEAKICRVKGYMWRFAEIYNNALRSFIEEGEIYFELEQMSMIELSLSGAKSILLKMQVVDEYDINKLDILFQKLPTSYNTQIIEINEIIKKMEKV